ncbi:DUF1080 domain-containing protein [Faecalicatena contorta]|uniref:LamG-like jellyroll fold domain-containing protein n=2 Tax=Faecalicatena contorta TaxID=39482 RepID=UPI00129E47AE|nr:LamG-like jellyroll fold domain-containing protein [Faecalicatena contorta]MRM89527.1 DUF1080 domain-containing protein [Faecalicatena contorta]
MKGKMMKRLLAMAIAAASIMSAPGLLTANAAGNTAGNTLADTAADTGVRDQAAVQRSTVETDTQPMEANGFLSSEGDTAEAVDGAADVSFGVVSDTHVRQDKATEKSRLAKAASFFSDAGLDRMVVAGDLTDSGSASEYDAWGSIINENLSIPLIASMGNHENNSADYFTKTTGNKPNNHQVVNGYHFITLSPGSGQLDPETGKGTTQGGGNYSYAVEWLEEQLTAAEADTPDKPIFVFFHHPIKNTFYVSTEWYGSGLDEVFKSHPHAVTFSGHIHSPNNMPTSIWQDGGYTAVNTVTLSYMEMETGMIYGSVPPNASQIAQGLVVEASGSRVTIKNYDFLADKWIPQTWTFDVNETLPYTNERAESAKAPYFGEGAALTVSEIKDNSAKLTFDQAKVPENNVGDLVHSYKYDFINTDTQAVVKTFKTWSNYYLQPMPEQITQVAPDLEGGTSYEVRIYAIDAYQKMSDDYLTQTFKTTGESSSEPGFDDMVTGVPKADLLDVDFSGGLIEDHSESGNTFYGSDGSNISMDEGLGKYVASFTGNTEEAFLTDWSAEQYDKTNDDFTIESTFKVDKFSDSYVDLFGNMESAGIGFEIPAYDEESASLEAWVHIGGSYKRPIAAGALKYGEWNHGVITYDGSKVTLYLNGQKIASREASGEVKTPPASSRYFAIGGDSGSNGSVQSPMVGAISTARLYSKALTAKQVSMLANRELPVIDKSKPEIQLASAPASEGTLNVDYTIPAAQAADNSTIAVLTAVVKDPDGTEILKLGGDASKTEETTFKPERAGTYQLIFTADDPAGNTETKSFSIEVKAGDRSKLDAAIVRAVSISDEELATYTEKSIARMMAALQRAMEITSTSGQEEIDTVTKELNDAIDGLEKKQETPQVDKTQLNELYEAVKGMTGEGYTEESYKALDAARTKALEIINSTAADQEAVDASYAELLAAKDALMAAEIQKYMELVLQAAAEADTADASKEALETFHMAEKELSELLEDSTAKTNVKAAKAIGVLRAMGGLNPDTVNTKVLKLAVQAAEVLNQSAYTVSSWSFFEAARLEAEGLLDEIEAAQAEAVNQETGGPADIPEADGLNLEPEKTYVEKVDAEKVNAAIEKLETAVMELTEKPVELLAKLNASIAKADVVLANTESYTPDSLKGLQEARDAAKALADAGEGDEEEMLQVLGTLDTLLGQVKNRADKAELVIALSKASLVKEAEYTKESLEAFKKALEEAKAVNEDLNVSDQAVVDQAVKTLEESMEKLVKIEDNSGNNGGNNGNQNSGSQNSGNSSQGSSNKPVQQASGTNSSVTKAVKTGDNSSFLLLAVLAMAGLAGAASAVVLRRKQR